MLQTKYHTKNRRPSYAFLMEMLWVCGFFAAAACIFVMAFVKADSMSSRAEDLNQAVTAADREMEQTLLSGREGSWIVCFDDSWNALSESVPEYENISETGPLQGAPGEAHALLQVSSQAREGLLTVAIEARVLTPREESVYSLTGSKSLTPDPSAPGYGGSNQKTGGPEEACTGRESSGTETGTNAGQENSPGQTENPGQESASNRTDAAGQEVQP